MLATLCDICGKQIPRYSNYYIFKYGFGQMFQLGTHCNEKLCVCKDCMEQVRECRKAALLNENRY
jgi:hypothetical protein